MAKDLVVSTAVPSVWDTPEGIAEVKKIYGKDLNAVEFDMFMAMGKATGLNPFLKEIFAYKYGSDATFIIARDGYRKSAQRHPEYDYHMADAVCSGDQFSVENGIVKHTYNMIDRGNLLGAYAIAKRKGSSQPCFVYVTVKEYNTGKSTWAKMPATMIKKVAESQVLRMAFQELFSNTYDRSEMWEDENKVNAATVNPTTGEILDTKPTNE